VCVCVWCMRWLRKHRVSVECDCFFFFFVRLFLSSLWPMNPTGVIVSIFGGRGEGHHKRTKCIAADVDPWRFLNAGRVMSSRPAVFGSPIRARPKRGHRMLLHLLFLQRPFVIGIIILGLKRAKRFQRLHALTKCTCII